jgi:DNA-binding MarR family transcriptional regulator
MRCYCASARLAARRLTRFYEAKLRQAGMNPAQFELMSWLRGRSRVSQSELAEMMDVDQTTLSRNLKLLVGQGWVLSDVAKRDRRRVEYRLSPEGRRALQKAMPHWQSATDSMRRAMGVDAENIGAVLERLASISM